MVWYKKEFVKEELFFEAKNKKAIEPQYIYAKRA